MSGDWAPTDTETKTPITYRVFRTAEWRASVQNSSTTAPQSVEMLICLYVSLRKQRIRTHFWLGYIRMLGPHVGRSGRSWLWLQFQFRKIRASSWYGSSSGWLGHAISVIIFKTFRPENVTVVPRQEKIYKNWSCTYLVFSIYYDYERLEACNRATKAFVFTITVLVLI